MFLRQCDDLIVEMDMSQHPVDDRPVVINLNPENAIQQVDILPWYIGGV